MAFLSLATVLTLLALASALQAAEDPLPPPAPVVFDVPRLDGIAVDGKSGDWGEGGFRVETLSQHGKGGAPVTEGPARLRLAWNERGLLVLVLASLERIEGTGPGAPPKDTSCNLVLAEARNLMNHYQVVAPMARLAADAEPVVPAASLVDRRLDQFLDPRLARETVRALTPLTAECGYARHPAGYALEVLLPWRNLGIERAHTGDLFHFQLMLFGGHGPMPAWYPEGWCEKAPWQMHRIRLAGKPSPPVTAETRVGRWRPEPSPGVHRHGAFALYIPPALKRVRGVYVTLPGKSHRTAVDEHELGSYSPMVPLAPQRAFVEHAGFALCGTMGPQTNAEAVLTALKTFAETTGHAELATAPLIVDGFSLGSVGTQALLNAAPERILAFTCMNFMDSRFTPVAAALKVPGLIYTGDKDGYGSGSRGAFEAARAQGAPWSLVIKPDTGHSTSDIYILLYPFYLDMIRARLPDGADALRELDPRGGWWGHTQSREVRHYDDAGRTDPKLSWLSSRLVGELWKVGWQRGGYTAAAVQQALKLEADGVK